MQRAQNRTGKGSILLWRRFTFPIFLLFIYALYILQQHCFNKIVLLVTWPIYFHAWIDAHVYEIFKQIFFFWLTGETCLSVLLYFLYTVHTVLHKRSCHPQDLLWVHGLVVFCLELCTSFAEIWTHNPDNLSTSDGYTCSRSRGMSILCRTCSLMPISANHAIGTMERGTRIEYPSLTISYSNSYAMELCQVWTGTAHINVCKL